MEPRTFPIESAIQISLDNLTWYKLTDHNRSEITITPNLIEKSERMANGTLRKYVVAVKSDISVSWTMVPVNQEETVDGNYSCAWLEAFYARNAGLPIYVKLVSAQLDPLLDLGELPDEETFLTSEYSETVYNAFITEFTKTLRYRTKTTDFVNMTLEFTEI